MNDMYKNVSIAECIDCISGLVLQFSEHCDVDGKKCLHHSFLSALEHAYGILEDCGLEVSNSGIIAMDDYDAFNNRIYKGCD